MNTFKTKFLLYFHMNKNIYYIILSYDYLKNRVSNQLVKYAKSRMLYYASHHDSNFKNAWKSNLQLQN